tara:strand:- start:437 stop:775 length:339 start_codon:yes stop_codon:yes gene_type:complete
VKAAELRKIRERDAYCVHCGADSGLQIHHRRNKQMGGSKLLDRLDNLLRVCAELNYAMEADAAIAASAREMGWKLRQWDGFDTPVFDSVQDKWFVLDKQGGKTESNSSDSLF